MGRAHRTATPVEVHDVLAGHVLPAPVEACLIDEGLDERSRKVDEAVDRIAVRAAVGREIGTERWIVVVVGDPLHHIDSFAGIRRAAQRPAGSLRQPSAHSRRQSLEILVGIIAEVGRQRSRGLGVARPDVFTRPLLLLTDMELAPQYELGCPVHDLIDFLAPSHEGIGAIIDVYRQPIAVV